jgi:hypothetical protein
MNWWRTGLALTLILALLASCSAGEDSRGGSEATSAPSAQLATIPVSPSATGPGAIPPDEFPTIAEIDFTRFPERLTMPPSPTPGGRVIFVKAGASGGDGTEMLPFGSPVRAVRAAGSGDVVLVGDGTYHMADRRCGCGLALWTDGVTLAAEHVGAVTFEPGGSVVDGLLLRGEHLAVVGLRLRGFRDAVMLGEEDHPVRDVVLQGLTLRGSGILMGVAETTPAAQVPVEGLLVADTSVRGGRRQIIGINCAQGPCNDVRVSGVTISLVPTGSGDSGVDAIGMESGDNVLVEATEVTGADGDGIDLKATRAAVVNCSVHAVGRNGVKLWKGGDVINTIIVDTAADAAVVFKLPARYRILHSIVVRHSPTAEAYAVTVSYDDAGAGQLDIVNSVFSNNSGAMWISADYDVDIRNSIFFDSLTGELLVWGDVVVEEGQGFGTLEDAGGGSGNREVDPRFVDAASDEFHLAPGSPGRGAGTADVELYPEFDFDGQPRGEDGPPDLGPYENA